jgi:hypothetical protein
MPWTFRALFEAQAFGNEIWVCRHIYGEAQAMEEIERRAKYTFASKDYYYMSTEKYAYNKIKEYAFSSINNFPLKNISLQYLEDHYG